MKLYQDPETERDMSDYISLASVNLKSLDMDSLTELFDNLSSVQETAYINHSELLSIALDMDIRKVEMFIKMKELKARRENK